MITNFLLLQEPANSGMLNILMIVALIAVFISS